MAEPTAAEIKTWLDTNKDKAGTPDYVTMTDAYAKAPGGGLPQDDPYSDFSGPAGVGMEQVTDPNAPRNIALRGVTNAVTGIPDTGIALLNVASKYGLTPQTKLPYLSSMMNAGMGVPDMPADAPWYQRAGEGLLAGAVGGIPGGVRGVAGSLFPSALGVAGGEGGAALGQALGVDPELLAILGGGLASQGRPAVTNVGRGTVAALYGGSGKPNAGNLMTAADRIDVQPTGATLGGPRVQALEQTLERRPGTGPRIMAEKERMRGEIGRATDAVPRAAGGTMTTPTEIGRATQETAGTALANLENRVSNRQQQLQNQMQGGEAPINVADLDRTLTQLVGTPSTSRLSTESTGPIQARLDDLRRMYAPAPEGQQGPPAPMVRQAPYVDWRNKMLTQRQNEAPIPREAQADMTGVARDVYRDAAIAHGVPPEQFDATQMLTRQVADQYRPTLEPLTARAQTDYETAYNRGPAAWDTNPQGQQDFRTAVNAGQGVAAGDPAVNNIAASRFNDLLAKTLHWRGDSATGPIKYADTMRNQMDPATVSGAVGPQGAQILQDAAELARASHRPTVQGGASQSLRDIIGGVTNRLGMPAIAAGGVHALGGGPAASGAAATAAAILQQAVGNPIDHIRAAMLNSQTAANSMAGRPTQYAPPSMADLVTSIRALQGSKAYGPPQTPYQLPDVTVAPPVSQ